ncbi:uncharacterized protein LOC141601833 [Silene latifolia]|uniref:uncharacterized protein LOC141601833 n=1 Tax=Silene latifolia TaxID=37657 RepID=UPI003D783323
MLEKELNEAPIYDPYDDSYDDKIVLCKNSWGKETKVYEVTLLEEPILEKFEITNLMFADDVLMFSNRDAASMMLLLKSFSTFSKTSGLKVSASKSNAYFNGVNEELKCDFLSVSGFKEGKLPFRYLGMPIQTTRLKKKDCECLVDKICNRIHSYGARKFSYTGRLTLVQHVLNSLHSYWASLFVLPKGVIQRIEATCRNFLWDGSAEYRRSPLVARDTICRPKQKGGLGLKNQELWNIAMVGRLVDWIATKKESLWVQWVNENYLKGSSWQEYTATSNSSWVWRRICKVKQVIVNGYSQGVCQVQHTGYTPVGCYEWLRGARTKVDWHNGIWDSWNLPKHRFMGWLIAHKSLHTNSRLKGFGMNVDGMCFLCGQAEEIQEHLFFECAFSRRVIQEAMKIFGLRLPDFDVLRLWCIHNTGLKTQRKVKNAMVLSAMYHVWQQRNKNRIEQLVLRPRCSALLINDDMKRRIKERDKRKLNTQELDWLGRLNFL